MPTLPCVGDRLISPWAPQWTSDHIWPIRALFPSDWFRDQHMAHRWPTNKAPRTNATNVKKKALPFLWGCQPRVAEDIVLVF